MLGAASAVVRWRFPGGASVRVEADNQREWSRSRIVSRYAEREGLLPPEDAWLSQRAERLRGARILDLGVGCGRTSPHLLRLSPDYVGIDYSPRMVACARRRFPDVDFRVGDARRLELPDGRFDLVVFSFNGIDMVARAERSQVLAEVRRVLAPRGIFFFSSHNLDRPPVAATDPRQINVTPNPIKMAWRSARWLAGVVHHLSRRRFEVRGEGWAVLNDKANNYRLLTCYISMAAQIEELASAGFELLEALDDHGAPVELGATTKSKLIYYEARAPARADGSEASATRRSTR